MSVLNLNAGTGWGGYRVGSASTAPIVLAYGNEHGNQPAMLTGDVLTYEYQCVGDSSWHTATTTSDGVNYSPASYTMTSPSDTGWNNVDLHTDSATSDPKFNSTTGTWTDSRGRFGNNGTTTINTAAPYTGSSPFTYARGAQTCLSPKKAVKALKVTNTTNAARSPVIVSAGAPPTRPCCVWPVGYYTNAVEPNPITATFSGGNYTTSIPWPPTFDGAVFDAKGWLYAKINGSWLHVRVDVQTVGTNTVLIPDSKLNVPANLNSTWVSGGLSPEVTPTDGAAKGTPFIFVGLDLVQGNYDSHYNMNCETGSGGTTPPSGSDTLKIYDEGTLVGTVTELNFTGTPVTATLGGARVNVAVTGGSGSLELRDNGTVLGNVTSLDIAGSGIKATISGTDGTITGNALVWKGDWSDSFDYKVNDVVRNMFLGNAYVCSADHTSSGGDEPGIGSWWAMNWDAMTDVTIGAMAPAEKDFLTALQDSVFDWIDTATVGDWLQALAVGAGIIYAGSKIMDMYSSDGQGDGNADSRFTGTAGYNGAFSAPNLQTVVTSLMTFAGYVGADFDVTQLPAKEVHFTISNTMPIRDILFNLSTVYQFDIVQSGTVVKFIPRNQSVVRTLTSSDLGHVRAESTMTGSAPYTAKRVQGIDLPRSVTLNYYSSALDHNIFTQVSTLETFTAGQDVKLEVPFTLDDAEAKRITESSLVTAHIEQQQYTFVTDYYNIDLEPGDIIAMPLDSGVTTNVRVLQITETDDGLLEFTVVRADFSSSSYAASGVTVTAPPAQTTNAVSSVGYSQSLFLEVPVLSDTDTSPRMLAAIHGYGADGWPGASLYRSVDGGATYDSVVTSNKTPTIGLVASAIAAPAVYQVWDTTTVISVQVKQGTLSNSTDIAVQNGTNWCMIGEEVIGFVNATLTGANTYNISRLLRGRAGSEVKCSTHVANELFVLLDDQLTSIPLDQADVNKTVKYKTVTVGSDISKVTSEDVKPFGLNMRPWRVAKPALKKEVNGDWTVTWLERPRYNNGLRDYTEINHDSDWGGYAVAFINSSDVTVRSATAVNTTFTYTVAMQVADFGSAQATMKASVIQMSLSAGGGYPYVVTA